LSVGRAPRASNDAAQTAHTALSALQTRIAAARYTAFVYEPAALPGAHAALLIEALHRIVKSLNGSVRAGCLALGGSDGALTVNQAMTWLSGLPLRTRIAGPASIEGAPLLDYDPYRYRMARLVADREIDALLFVASFAPPMTLPDCDPRVPAIVLGPPALAQAANARGAATVFMPVATPGIDSGGHLFRTDGTVVLPLRAARAAPLPTVAALASELLARLDAQPERIQVQP
jgi:formylmethanofuran dehydrogenase subunit B